MWSAFPVNGHGKYELLPSPATCRPRSDGPRSVGGQSVSKLSGHAHEETHVSGFAAAACNFQREPEAARGARERQEEVVEELDAK